MNDWDYLLSGSLDVIEPDRPENIDVQGHKTSMDASHISLLMFAMF